MIGFLLIVLGYVFIIYRTHVYLKPKRLGRRAQLQMKVCNGRVYFKSKPHSLVGE